VKLEAKVGLFVFIGLLSLFLVSMQVNKLQMLNKSGYQIEALLNDATGLEKSSKVRVNGVEVGYVKNFILDGNRVRAILFIFDGVKIPKDSTLLLSQDGILGSKEISISAGDSKQYLSKGDSISKERNFASFDKTSDSIYQAANEFKDFISEVRETLNSEVKSDLQKSVANFESFSSKLDKILSENREELKSAISNLNSMGESLSSAGDKFGSMSDKFALSADSLNSKLPEILEKIDDISTNLKSSSDSLDSRLPQILAKFESIEDDLGEILKDNKEPLNSALKSVDKFFTDGNEAVEKIDKMLSSVDSSKLELSLKSEYQISDEYSKDSIALDYSPSPSRHYLVEVISSDDYSRVKDGLFLSPKKHEDSEVYFSFQFGKRYDDFMLRWGIKESSGGVGIDYYALNDNFRASLDFFDFNAKNDVRGDNLHSKFALRYTFLKHLDTYIGYDNFLNSKADNLFFGAGVRFVDDDLKLLLGSNAGAFLQ
jgi:phospholipid/cholesterol/gamma-HCH transport system substrate-binding protein